MVELEESNIQWWHTPQKSYSIKKPNTFLRKGIHDPRNKGSNEKCKQDCICYVVDINHINKTILSIYGHSH